MAITQVNIYRATAYLSAGNAAGVLPVATPGPPGQAEVVIIATSYADAIAVLQQQYPTGMVGYTGPVLVATGAITIGSGPFAAAQGQDTVGLPPAHSDAPPQEAAPHQASAHAVHPPTHSSAHAKSSHAK